MKSIWKNDMISKTSKHLNETIILRAIGDRNGTSNTEQINIKVIEKGAKFGFELVFVIGAITAVLFLWRKKRNI